MKTLAKVGITVLAMVGFIAILAALCTMTTDNMDSWEDQQVSIHDRQYVITSAQNMGEWYQVCLRDTP